MSVDERATTSVCSPPLLGVGVGVGGRISCNNYDPPPHPSPTRREGADRVCCSRSSASSEYGLAHRRRLDAARALAFEQAVKAEDEFNRDERQGCPQRR